MHGQAVFHRDLNFAENEGLKIVEKLVCDVVSAFVYVFIGNCFDLICDSRNGAETNGNGVGAVGVVVTYKESKIARIACSYVFCATCTDENALFDIGF